MMKRWTLLLMVAALLISTMAGCAPSTGEEQTGEQYIDPVYPPHFETTYKELMGVDLDTAIAKLGYSREDFTLTGHPTALYYRSNETVNYLGREFYVELHFLEENTRLYQVCLCSDDLTGTAEEQAKTGVEFLHTLRKMFGLHFAKKDEKDEKKYIPDEAAVVEWMTGEEEKAWGTTWEVFYEMDHIPEKAFTGKLVSRENSAFQLVYLMHYNPNTEGTFLRLTYKIGMIASNHFVRN